jgi:hypothetical protein
MSGCASVEGARGLTERFDGATGSPIEPFTLANSMAFSGETAVGIASLAVKAVQIRF